MTCASVGTDHFLDSWVQQALCVVRGMKVATVECAIADVATFAKSVSDAAPKLEAFINDKVYIRTRATKQLLDWPHRAAYCDDAVKLFHAIQSSN